MPFVLIVVTYLGGSAWGPAVSFAEFSTQARCEAAKAEVLRAVEHMNGSNLRGVGTQREIVRAACQEK